ncbi:MAG: tyrosine-type recombinase/integrase [Nitrospirae bacterium]|nr:tyrosine-type recombinase/integrase [Nitrospirota bacterium]
MISSLTRYPAPSSSLHFALVNSGKVHPSPSPEGKGKTITRLAQAGVDLYKIAKLLGHNDISTTQRYAHHCPESLRSSVDILTEYYNSTTVKSNAEGEPVHAPA